MLSKETLDFLPGPRSVVLLAVCGEEEVKHFFERCRLQPRRLDQQAPRFFARLLKRNLGIVPNRNALSPSALGRLSRSFDSCLPGCQIPAAEYPKM